MLILLGLVVGMVLGLSGAGGALIAVPLLVWGLGWSIQQAVPVALLAVCAAATLGTITSWKASRARYRAAALIAGVGVLTAPFGLLTADALPTRALSLVLAVLLLAAAARLWTLARQGPASATERTTVCPCRLHPDTGRLVWSWRCALALSVLGAVVGFLAALIGVGGGIVLVPSLRSISELSMHSAVATSLMATALISAPASVLLVASGRELPWGVAGVFALGAIAGILLGRRLAPRISAHRLQSAFSILLLASSSAMAVQALRAG